LFTVVRPDAAIGLVPHSGILDTGNYLGLAGRPAYGYSAIVHLNQDGYQVEWVQALEPWHIVGQATDPHGAALRLRETIKKHGQYDLFSNNCEHVANGVVHGQRESPRLQGVMVVSAIALLVFLAKNE
jgi:hypothetical protein